MQKQAWSYYLVVGIFLFFILPLTGLGNQIDWSGLLLDVVRPSAQSEVGTAPASPTPAPLAASVSASPRVLGATLYPVTSVVDGDTIKVEIDGQVKTVRLVGINTPETVDPRKPVECMGAAASARLKELLEGQAVNLESDPTQSDQDRYGRLLRFVFLANGLDVGRQLLEDGLAQESLYSSKPHVYRTEYVDAQLQAQAAQKGLWAPEACI